MPRYLSIFRIFFPDLGDSDALFCSGDSVRSILDYFLFVLVDFSFDFINFRRVFFDNLEDFD